MLRGLLRLLRPGRRADQDFQHQHQPDLVAPGDHVRSAGLTRGGARTLRSSSGNRVLDLLLPAMASLVSLLSEGERLRTDLLVVR